MPKWCELSWCLGDIQRILCKVSMPKWCELSIKKWEKIFNIRQVSMPKWCELSDARGKALTEDMMFQCQNGAS